MIIYNITFHIENSILEEYLFFLKEEYIPQAMINGALLNPRLCKILASSDDGSSSYSLQFHVENHENLDNWRKTEELLLHELTTKRFSNKVLGFITLLEELDSI